LLSLVFVSKEIVTYVRREAGLVDVTVELVGTGGSDIGMEVRQQITDTPVEMPAPTEVARAEIASPDDAIEPPASVQVRVPQAAPRMETMVVRPTVPPAPQQQPVADERVTVEAPQPQRQVEVALDAPQPVRADAPPVQPVVPEAATATQVASATPPAAAAEVVTPNVRATPPEVQSLAEAPRPAAGAQAESPGPAAAVAPAEVAATPTLQGPQVQGEKVAAADVPQARATSDAQPAAQRQAASDVPSAAPTAVSVAAPAATSAEAAVGANSIEAMDAARPAPAGVAEVRPDTETTPTEITVAVPGAAAAKVATAQAPTVAATEEAVGAPKARAVTDPGASASPQLTETSPGPVDRDAVAGSVPVRAPGPATRPVAAERPAIAATVPNASPAPVPLVGPAGTPARASEKEAGVAVSEQGVASARLENSTTAGAPQLGPTAAPGAAPATNAAPASMASAPSAGPRELASPSASVALGTNLPPVEAPPVEVASAAPAGLKAVAPEKPLPSSALDNAALASARSAPAKGDESGGPRSIASLLEAPAAAPKPSATGTLASGAVEPRVGDVVAAPLNLEVSIAGPRVAVPEGLAQRSPEARKPLVEKLGGNEESEDAVGRALAWLARQQEPDGRWTYVSGNSRPGQRPPRPHDTALTGLALLAFLGADHTPDKPGPYQKLTAAAVEYLLAQQRSNGDLRGRFAGGGADAGNMYDQGIATLALCEAALMTGDGRVVEAATRGAEFIVKAQHRQTGGWRYVPGEHGDTSVFGWQVMALHSAKQLGVEVPQRTSELAA
ncbi:MAG TPA: hypothetical protein VFB66_03730, partial [Tepidisphaeraceae bacterium]|nr:hypothetical protein [Tepidisphaeraceae bacterium]